MLNLYLSKVARLNSFSFSTTLAYHQNSLKDQLQEKQEIFRFINNVQQMNVQDIDQVNSSFIRNLSSSYDQDWMSRQSKPLHNFYPYIKQKILAGDYQPLNEASSYMFQKEGKLIRPLLNLMINKFTLDSNQESQGESQQLSISSQKKQLRWAAVIEILHVASLIHDDIIDNSEFRRGLKTLHTTIGNYMIGRAYQLIVLLKEGEKQHNLIIFKCLKFILTQWKIQQMYILINYIKGEYLQALKYKDYTDYKMTMQNYLFKTYYKTASLIAHSLIGVCNINQVDQQKTIDMFYVGLHLGIAFQIIDDVLDYTSNQMELGKSNLSDLRSGVITGPVLLEFYSMNKDSQHYSLFSKIINKQSTLTEEIDQVNQIVLAGTGIKRSQYIAFLHADQALKILEQYNDDKNKDIYNDIRSAIYYILSRNK